MSVADYTSMIKEICNSIATINVAVEVEMVFALPTSFSAEVQIILKNDLHERENIILLRATIYASRRREQHECIDEHAR